MFKIQFQMRIKLAEEIHTKNDHSCKENGNKLNKSK